jgi:uncharacterized OB-fold protein
MTNAADYFGLAGRPIPEALPEWRGYFEGCKEGRLLIEECASCKHRQFYPRGQCIVCGDATHWLECSGLGSVYTFTTVRMTKAAPFDGIVPYHLAMIELDEGVRMNSALLAPGNLPIRIGMRVKVVFGELANSGVWAAAWEPQSAAAIFGKDAG